MIKYGFIADPSMLKVDLSNYENYILRAGSIKREIVAGDFSEQGRRKVLNFGHTLGHAFESVSNHASNPLTHGEAVAMGMWCALWLSVRQCGLPEQVLQDYGRKMQSLLSLASLSLDEQDLPAVMNALFHDKKSRGGCPRFVLLPEVGHPVYDCEVPEPMVHQAIFEVMKEIH